MKKKLIALSLLTMGLLSFGIKNQVIAGDTTCGTTICVVDEAKNRFLARGCKSKPDFDCAVGGPGLPDIGIL